DDGPMHGGECLPPPIGPGGKRLPRPSTPPHHLSLAQCQPHEKTVGQHHRDRMAVETRPHPAPIVIPPQFSPGLLLKLVDRMPAMSIGDQLLHWGRGWQVTPIVLVLLGLPTGGALPEPPADVGLPLRCKPPSMHRDALFPPPALGTLPPADDAPWA